MMSTREATGKLPKGLQRVLNLRTHQQSIPLWLAIQFDLTNNNLSLHN